MVFVRKKGQKIKCEQCLSHAYTMHMCTIAGGISSSAHVAQKSAVVEPIP